MGMQVRLGTTLDGQVVRLDISAPSLTMLLADAGQGKTTLARHLTRWWLARTRTTVTVHARRPCEWSDFSGLPAVRLLDLEEDMSFSTVEPDNEAAGRTPARPFHLTVIDGVDSPGLSRLPGLPPPGDLAIVTAASDWLGASVAEAAGRPGHVYRWGLLPLHVVGGHDSATSPTGTVDPLQYRLDWGSQTQPLLPCRLGPRDYPRHRWADQSSEQVLLLESARPVLRVTTGGRTS